jgi:hypothetical protein
MPQEFRELLGLFRDIVLTQPEFHS